MGWREDGFARRLTLLQSSRQIFRLHSSFDLIRMQLHLFLVGIECGGKVSLQHSKIAVVSFETTTQKFTQLSGCFVATAAYGSALEPHVAALRHARDRLRPVSPLFAAATDLYYRSGPAAAAVVGQSEVARGLARRVIAPFASLAEALDAVAPPVHAGR